MKFYDDKNQVLCGECSKPVKDSSILCRECMSDSETEFLEDEECYD